MSTADPHLLHAGRRRHRGHDHRPVAAAAAQTPRAARRTWLNRATAVPEAGGGFRLVVAHRDPGVPNWLDTEGRPFGLVFWRFMLPEGEIATPEARVVPLADVARA